METPKNMRANGTIRVSRFVKMDATVNNSVIEGTANAEVIGISGEWGRTPPIPENTTDPVQHAIATESCRVYGLGECCKVVAGATIVAGNRLKSHSDGTALPITANGRVGAIALEGGASGELVSVQVVIYDRLSTAS